MAGVRRSTALSNIAAVSPSITTRTSFFGLASVPGKDAEARVTLPAAAPETGRERGHREPFEIPEARHPRERGDHDGREPDERRRAEPRAPAAEGAADDLRRPDHSERPPDRAADRLVPLAEAEPDQDPRRGGREHRRPEDEP